MLIVVITFFFLTVFFFFFFFFFFFWYHNPVWVLACSVSYSGDSIINIHYLKWLVTYY
jgi:hypothetical protein